MPKWRRRQQRRARQSKEAEEQTQVVSVSPGESITVDTPGNLELVCNDIIKVHGFHIRRSVYRVLHRRPGKIWTTSRRENPESNEIPVLNAWHQTDQACGFRLATAELTIRGKCTTGSAGESFVAVGPRIHRAPVTITGTSFDDPRLKRENISYKVLNPPDQKEFASEGMHILHDGHRKILIKPGHYITVSSGVDKPDEEFDISYSETGRAQVNPASNALFNRLLYIQRRETFLVGPNLDLLTVRKHTSDTTPCLELEIRKNAQPVWVYIKKMEPIDDDNTWDPDDEDDYDESTL